MIALRSSFDSIRPRKSRRAKVGTGAATGDLLRGLQPEHQQVRDLGTTVVGRRARSVDRRVSAKPSVGPNVTDADTYAEPDCGA